ncbi:MAG: molybdopterin-dependent oxidoreductase [Actinobacteria bacterium]|nr:molybdopterin-dependent oxidoreductase [Actinomycetota bacterium]
MTDTSAGSTTTINPPATGVGNSVDRPDASAKVLGSFEFSNDLNHERMLWGATIRSPHPSARIVSINVAPALAIPGVAAVVTHHDVPGSPVYGLISHDQPVFASDVVRYQGEPVAAVAADHPDTCRRAMVAVEVVYEVTEPVVDLLTAATAKPVHPDGNVVRRVPIRFGDVDAVGDIVVEGTYEMGMQDQAFMGPESGMAVPAAGDGSIDLYVATQWLHEDRDQVADCLGLARDDVRIHLAGTGGAFGAREDVSFHVHACLLAQHTNRPVKMQYRRDESFLGHVHRHPAHMTYRHHATNDGRLVKVECDIVLDGGAYASSSFAVCGNAARFAAGPYKVPNAVVNASVVRTNNPPCGAMRGFGAVQVCFGHEAQMDKLAAALDMDPLEIRLLNALETGDRLITGQILDGVAPVRECIEAAAAFPLPPISGNDVFDQPGGAGRTADPLAVRRGVGFAVGFKNAAFAEGFVDDTHARCRLENGQVTLWCAAAEVGQGFVTIVRQIAVSTLGTDRVELMRASTADIGSAGSTSASRQTYMSGAAVLKACEEVAEQVRLAIAATHDVAPELVTIEGGRARTIDGRVDVIVADAIADVRFEAELRHMHRETYPLDEETGQGDCDVTWIFAAHRAVVDVDVELGLVKVVEVTTGQDVGVALNPLHVIGQIEGGISQGVGLAVMEEIITDVGLVRNPSFTDYLLPTMVDMPDVRITLIEQPEEGGPFGAKGVGETPSLSSTPAVAAAVRAATGLELTRVPIKPQDIALG